MDKHAKRLLEMSYYRPDNWVVIYMKGDDPHYRVLAGWSGGYTTGDSWRMNSGIKEVIQETDDKYLFVGTSGSTYACHKNSYGLRMNNAYIWEQLKERYGDKVELLNEDTDWSKIDWLI